MAEVAAVVSSSAVTEIRALLDAGDTRGAVDRARVLHAGSDSDESEALLAEAYRARLAGLRARGLGPEADALEALLRRRHSAIARRLATSAEPSLAELLAPLADPSLPVEERQAIEEALRRRAVAPSMIAACIALPETHPLRVEAASVAQAFELATTTQVAEATLEQLLSAVSRKGPLAPFKLLIRAIGALHRGDDERAAATLSAIDASSGAARLVPAATAVLAGGAGPSLPAGAARLVAAICSDPAELSKALTALDVAFGAPKGSDKKIFAAIERACAACEAARPELLVELRQRVSIRAAQRRLPFATVRKAAGGTTPKDAAFFRRYATSFERDAPLHAACAWDAFRRQAVREGLFELDSLAAAAVFARMAGLCERASDDQRTQCLKDFDGFAGFYEGQPAALAAQAIPRARVADELLGLEPTRLLERAVSMDPDPALFARWLVREEARPRGRPADAAKAWCAALPNDPRPHLVRAKLSAARGHVGPALTSLAAAEVLDPLDPSIRPLRFGLRVGAILRPIRQAKVHLAVEHMVALLASSDATTGPRRALVEALACVVAELLGQAEEAQRHAAAVERQLGPAAPLLIDAVRLRKKAPGRVKATGRKQAGRVEPPPAGPIGLAAAQLLTLDRLEAGPGSTLLLDLPPHWIEALEQELGASELNAAELLVIAEWAGRRNESGLREVATRAGLALSGRFTGQFLLLRALTIFGQPLRRAHCLAIAAELGRRQRDESLAATARQKLAELMGDGPQATLPDEVVERVLAFERAPATSRTGRGAADERYAKQCGCPLCDEGPARAAGFPAGLFDDEEEDDEDDDDDEDHELSDPEEELLRALRLPPSLSAGAQKLMGELYAHFGQRGPASPQALLQEAFRRDPVGAVELFAAIEAAGLGPPNPGRKRR